MTLHAMDTADAVQFVGLTAVRRHVPVGRRTLLNWEAEGLLTIWRPNARRAYVDLQEVLQLWEGSSSKKDSATGLDGSGAIVSQPTRNGSNGSSNGGGGQLE